MIFRDVVELAATELTRNFRRSAIAVLGLIAGVAALVALDTLGRATSFYLLQFIEHLGQTKVIRVSALDTKGMGPASRGFTQRDIKRVGREMPYVERVSASVTDYRAMLSHGKEALRGFVTGVDSYYMGVFRLTLQRGRSFSPEDSAERAAVAILGSEVEQRLFGGDDPLGRICIAEGVPVRVVGVLEPSISEQANQTVFVPVDTALTRFHDCRKLNTLYMESDDLDHVRHLAEALDRHFAGRAPNEMHRQRYEVWFNKSALDQIQNSILILKVFVLAVSTVTLILGGVGIMNIFLSSLAERTVEVGIRKAVGATDGEIAFQILTEAFLLCLVGSWLGGGGGLLIVQVVVRVTGQPELGELSPMNIVGVVIFASLIGLVFAISPALRAANKDVIEAIRSI